MANEKKNVPVVPEVKKDLFFGWANFKWLIIELRDIYSNRDSYFSKKRIESGIGFIVAEWGMIYYLTSHMDKMDIMTFGGWASIQFLVAGYMIKQIQNEKASDIGKSPVDIPIVDNPDAPPVDQQ